MKRRGRRINPDLQEREARMHLYPTTGRKVMATPLLPRAIDARRRLPALDALDARAAT